MGTHPLDMPTSLDIPSSPRYTNCLQDRHTHPPRRDLIPEIPTPNEKTWGQGYPHSPVDKQTLVKTFQQICRLRLDNGLAQWSNQYMKGVGYIILSITALPVFTALKEARGTFMIRCYQEKHRSQTITHENKMTH